MYIPADSIVLTEDSLLRIGHLRIEGSESVDEGLLFTFNSVHICSSRRYTHTYLLTTSHVFNIEKDTCWEMNHCRGGKKRNGLI